MVHGVLVMILGVRVVFASVSFLFELFFQSSSSGWGNGILESFSDERNFNRDVFRGFLGL